MTNTDTGAGPDLAAPEASQDAAMPGTAPARVRGGNLGRYLATRFLLIFPTIFILVTVVFFLMRSTGDPITAALGKLPARVWFPAASFEAHGAMDAALGHRAGCGGRAFRPQASIRSVARRIRPMRAPSR